MDLITVLLMSAALSIDGFGVGLAYGFKKIKVTFLHILLISLSASLAMGASIVVGRFLGTYFPTNIGKVIGGTVLTLIGLWHLFDGWRRTREHPLMITIRIRIFGIIVNILSEPKEADLDDSGDINFKEALLLSIALNIDAFGSGVGASLAGYSLLIGPIVALFLFTAIRAGLLIGHNNKSRFLQKKGYLLTGLILIFLGIINFI